jgi:hypothetical protein
MKLFSSGQSAFRVGFKDTSFGGHRIFLASNEHVRKHWMYCMKQVTSPQVNSKTKFLSLPEGKKIKTDASCKRINKSSWNENNAQLTHPLR